MVKSQSYSLLFSAVQQSNGKNNPTCSIKLIKNELLNENDYRLLSSNEVHGVVGLIELEGLIFMGVITGKSKVAQPIPGETVNIIISVDFFCLNRDDWDLVDTDASGFPIISNDNGSPDMQESLPKHPCHELKKLLSNGSFYYSSTFDLTSRLQNRGLASHSLSSDNYEEEYMWNSFLMQEIVSYRDRLERSTRDILDDEGFLTTVIRGFAETFTTYIKQLKVMLTIICKQSWKRAGTRFNARGIDDDGNVANFVETEFIMYSGEWCYAFTQIRGSIPVFWEQGTSLINPKLQITRSQEATQPIFDKHIKRSIDKYGPVHIVNLLSSKTSEAELSKRYREHLQKSNKLVLNEDVKLTEFDFHHETAQEGFSGARKLIPMIMPSMLDSGYYLYDVTNKKIISEQHGIFRTNCLDCLDRTNLIQQILSLQAFKMFLVDSGLVSKNNWFDEDDFVTRHNTLWADHGDQISQIYTGTNALKSSFSRKGKMSLAGALSDATKSVSRIYINNFMDKDKQQNIDTLLGRLVNQRAVELYDPVNTFVSEELSKMTTKYTTQLSMDILAGTYNVNGTTRKVDLSRWLFPIGDKFKPDIVVLGLQEVIELSAGSILNADYSKSSFWKDMVNDCLNQYDEKYVLLRAEQMTSLLTFLFVKTDKAKYVKQVEGATKKTGFGGIAGNKGAVSIRFEYGATSFCVVNSHLAAGVANVEERRNDFESIYEGITFSRSKKISAHDSIIWLGDMNYRIQLPNEQVRHMLDTKPEKYIEKLLNNDQLTREIAGGYVFPNFNEPTINFRPTYKFNIGSNVYDSGEKARTPSWTDRILYKGSNLQPLAYNFAQLTLSDHRPVYAAYRSRAKLVDEDELKLLKKELYNKYKLEHPDETSSINSTLIDLGLDDNSLSKGSTRVSSHVSSQPMSLLEPKSSPSINSSLIPPPAVNEIENSAFLSAGSSNSSSTSALNTLNSNPSVRPKLRPPPPPAFNSKGIHVNNDVQSESKTKYTEPAIKPVQRSPPPGFTTSILTPKNSTATNGKAVRDSKPSGLESSESSQEHLSNSLQNVTLNSWQPLEPK